MIDKLSFYQINLNKCEAAQANLMVELINFKDKQFICLIQEPHFQGSSHLLLTEDICRLCMVKEPKSHGQEP